MNAEDRELADLYQDTKDLYGDREVIEIFEQFNKAPFTMPVPVAWAWAIDKWTTQKLKEVGGDPEQ